MQQIVSKRQFSQGKAMRAAIYARVSTEQQDDAIQLADLRGFVQRWGWEEALYGDKLTGKEGIRQPARSR
jgi:DNA invertase Pin-like site-specific DNA recombinase